MQYIERDLEKKMLEWKNKKGHCALEVKGVRQSGKTTMIKHFVKKEYTNAVYVSFAERSGDAFLKELNSSVDEVDFIKRYCKKTGITFSDSPDTVIILDEIQESEAAYKLIRPFNRRLHCDVIVTGSYLGKAAGYFQPVGDLSYLTLETFSFHEFLKCFAGAAEAYDNIMLYDIKTDKFDWFAKAYKVYSIVGGYPGVIAEYLAGGDYCGKQKEVLDTLVAELKTRTTAISAYNRISTLLFSVLKLSAREKKGDKNLNEHLTTITKKRLNNFSISKEETYSLISWLLECGIIGYCDKINLANYDYKENERFYVKDLGMLNYLANGEIGEADLNGIRSETFVYRSLLDGYAERFYHSVPAFGVYDGYESDFIVTSRYDGLRYLIEVKSGSNNSKSAVWVKEHHLVDKVVYFKGNSHEGKSEDSITLPIWLAERFNYDLGKCVVKEKLPQLSAF
ncbi:MAG: ATP-binding protein [Lachnospiraceae bacterium]|nr:ATP-binding protein [Lachnospiraceae bacterium]